MKTIAGLLVALSLAFSSLSALADDVFVNGYYRSDGTYVQPHYRSAPDGDVSNNWSTQGNVNPYTGAVGTNDPYGGGSSFGTPSYGSTTTEPGLFGSGSNCIGLLC